MFEFMIIITLLLLLLIGPVFSTVALVFVIFLRKRVRQLEGLVQSLTAEMGAPVKSGYTLAKESALLRATRRELQSTVGDASTHIQAKPSSMSDAGQITSSQAAPSSIPMPIKSGLKEAKPDPFSQFFSWLAKDWYLKVGALLVLLAAVWFITYAFVNNWIGPAGQVMIGLVTGMVVMTFAQWWQQRSSQQATILMILGSGMIMASVYASRTVYDMFTPEIALTILLMVTGMIGISSGVANAQSRAAVGLLLATAIPFLIHGNSEDFFGLMRYLIVVVLGFLPLILWRRWKAILFGLGIFVLLFTLPQLNHLATWRMSIEEASQYIQVIQERDDRELENWGWDESDDVDQIQWQQSKIQALQAELAVYATMWYYTVGFTLILLVVALYVVSKSRALSLDMLGFLSMLALYTIYWIYAAVPMYLQSLSAVLAAVVFAGMTVVSVRVLENRRAATVLLFIALGLLVGAVAFELGGPALSIVAILVLTIGALGSSWLLGSTTKNKLLGLVHGISFTIALYWLLDAPSSKDLPWEAWSVVVVLISCMAVTISVWKRWWQAGMDAAQVRWLSFYYLPTLFIGLLLYFQIIDRLLSQYPNAAEGITLTTVAILGIVLYLRGKVCHGPVMRWTGIALVGYVTAWLLLVASTEMAIPIRIITFLVVGLVFMGVAFVEQKVAASKK